jgi:hypothetical protein
MNKQLVAEQISAIQNKIKELSKLRFKYFIYGKYIPGFGDIKTIEDITTLLKAFSFVKSQFNCSETTELANELGLVQESIAEQEDLTYLGFTLEEWTEEFKTKAKELQTATQLEQLELAETKLSKYLSESDLLNKDYNEFKSLFSQLNIDMSTCTIAPNDVPISLL